MTKKVQKRDKNLCALCVMRKWALTLPQSRVLYLEIFRGLFLRFLDLPVYLMHLQGKAIDQAAYPTEHTSHSTSSSSKTTFLAALLTMLTMADWWWVSIRPPSLFPTTIQSNSIVWPVRPLASALCGIASSAAFMLQICQIICVTFIVTLHLCLSVPLVRILMTHLSCFLSWHESPSKNCICFAICTFA